MNQKVLEKLLKSPSLESQIREVFNPGVETKDIKEINEIKKRPGRPKVPREKKARNFTLCLPRQYVDFLDRMKVKDSKIQGRGRKIRFIIERFIQHEKRSLHQVKIIKESLAGVQKVLLDLGGRDTKSQKVELSTKEKKQITEAIERVHTVLNLLGYSPRAIEKLLPKEFRALLKFSLDWKHNGRVLF